MKRLPTIPAALVRMAGTVASAAGRGDRGLLIMIYHRVLEAPDPLRPRTPDAVAFSAQMDLVASCFNVLPLDEALDRMQSGSLPARALCVTFDDGYADNLSVAAPIMRQHGVHATVFVATGYLDGGLMFNDAITEAIRGAPSSLDLSDLGLGEFELVDDQRRLAAIRRLVGELKYRPAEERRDVATEIFRRAGTEVPGDMMLTTAQLRQLRDSGIAIGAHTETHPILSRLEPVAARNDMARGKEALEAIVGETIRLFAYPNGRPGEDFDGRHVAMARELGFSAALSTAWGAAHRGCDLFQVPRVAPWDAQSWRYAARLVRSYLQRQYPMA